VTAPIVVPSACSINSRNFCNSVLVIEALIYELGACANVVGEYVTIKKKEQTRILYLLLDCIFTRMDILLRG
jgi:hypothetical protein